MSYLNLSVSPHAIALAQGFDLFNLNEAFYQDPFPTYHALRSIDPQKRMSDGSLFITRYEDVRAIYADTQRFSSDKKIDFLPKFGASPLFEHHTSSLVFNDPPLHTRVRKVLVEALSPRVIDAMLPGLERTVQGLLNTVEAKGCDGTVDAIEHFASAIPIEVIGNLLGVPSDERGSLREWSLAILGALEPQLTDAQVIKGNLAVQEFLAYLKTLVRRRRLALGDPKLDVLTRLIVMSDSTEELSEAELLHNCIFLLNAGHETTTNLIGNGLACLARFPSERSKLIAQPELINLAVEEFLRFESSNQLGNRRSVAAFDIAGISHPAGTRLHLCIGAANRDPSQFVEPDTLNISRHPNRHLAFGFGAHVCAGLNLARLEGRIAIAAWLKRFPQYDLVESGAIIGGRARFRGFSALPVFLKK